MFYKNLSCVLIKCYKIAVTESVWVWNITDHKVLHPITVTEVHESKMTIVCPKIEVNDNGPSIKY